MPGKMPDFLREDLVRRFRHAAMVTHFGYEDENIAMQHAGIDAVQQTVRELDAFGADARSILIPLLEDPDSGIRVFAARHVLDIVPTRALAVIKEIRDRGQVEARKTAARFLEKYESGEL
jgi:hypothetical protein